MEVNRLHLYNREVNEIGNLISTAEAAKLLGVKPGTVLRLIRERKITATRPAKDFKVHEDSVRQLIADKTTTAIPQEEAA
jgi:excisionase family DNA binding protein